MRRTILAMGILASLAACGAAGPATSPATRPAESSAAAPKDLVLRDIDGVERHPLAAAEKGKGAVLFFIAHDCPISNSYAPEINRICAAYGGAGKFTFGIVHPYAELTVEEAKKHAKDFSLTAPVFIDAKHVLCDRVGSTITPSVAVVSPDGKVLYLGRIDDKWAGYGKSRVEPTVRDLRAALDAILDGKAVPTARTDAIGCPI
jgi:hypothetical protein